jgi:LacI family transcriptional regulator
MSSSRRIALFLEAALAYDRGVLAGIARHSTTRGDWSLAINVRDPWSLDAQRTDLACAGVIANVQSPDQVSHLQQTNLPVVNIGEAMESTPFPLVTYDQVAIGQAAAEHLIQTGLKRFAYVGHAGMHGCLVRGQAFAQRIAAAGYDCQQIRTTPPPDESQDELTEWLKGAAKPIGVLACDDLKARDVLEAARAARLHVPEEIAVVGVDDDDLIHNITQPALSSVRVPADTVGQAAAELLDQMIDGSVAPIEPIRYQPFGVAGRRSSDAMTLSDPELIAAVRYIRENADQPIQVVDVLENVAMSRRSLERRFREYLGRSPQQEIQRVHLERARALLAGTDMAVAEIARSSGFRNADRLAAVFRLTMQMTPTDYRSRYRTA